MAILEFEAIATKVTVKDGEVHAVSAVKGGQTVRMIYKGMNPLIAIAQATKVDVLQIEDKVEHPYTPWTVITEHSFE